MVLIGLLSFLLINAADPTAPIAHGEPSDSIAVPRFVFGRSFRALTEDYILYANTSAGANEVRKWLDIELDEFEHAYGAKCDQRMIYVSIDSTEEPDPWIASLPERHDPNHTYAFTPGPYFHEAICAPNPSSGNGNATPDESLVAKSICLLPTTAYFDRKFDDELRDMRAARVEEVKQVPLAVRVLSAPAMPFMYLEAVLFMPKIKKLDRQLMLLQRKQVMWLNWIDCAFANDEPRRVGERQRLLQTIDKEWWEKLAKRPRD